MGVCLGLQIPYLFLTPVKVYAREHFLIDFKLYLAPQSSSGLYVIVGLQIYTEILNKYRKRAIILQYIFKYKLSLFSINWGTYNFNTILTYLKTITKSNEQQVEVI